MANQRSSNIFVAKSFVYMQAIFKYSNIDNPGKGSAG